MEISRYLCQYQIYSDTLKFNTIQSDGNFTFILLDSGKMTACTAWIERRDLDSICRYEVNNTMTLQRIRNRIQGLKLIMKNKKHVVLQGILNMFIFDKVTMIWNGVTLQHNLSYYLTSIVNWNAMPCTIAK